ncbi:MAG: hypothetical protein JNK72_15470 [Myxococcales bacterium]|nr:hypothetical protein [Myxococcales bacterium]
MNAPRFVSVEVDEGPASDSPLSLRFKTISPPEPVRALDYESETGLDGTWRVEGVDDVDSVNITAATAALVDDSSDGAAWLIMGGRHGLRLTHAVTGAVERAPYLLLSQRRPPQR